MSVVFIDTNALFKGKTVFEKLIDMGYNLCTSPLIIYEFVKVIDELVIEEKNEERRKLYKRLRRRLPFLLRDLEIEIIPHELTYTELEEAYNVMHEKDVDIGDAMIYILLRRKGIQKILTYDDDWGRMDIEVVQ